MQSEEKCLSGFCPVFGTSRQTMRRSSHRPASGRQPLRQGPHHNHPQYLVKPSRRERCGLFANGTRFPRRAADQHGMRQPTRFLPHRVTRTARSEKDWRAPSEGANPGYPTRAESINAATSPSSKSTTRELILCRAIMPASAQRKSVRGQIPSRAARGLALLNTCGPPIPQIVQSEQRVIPSMYPWRQFHAVIGLEQPGAPTENAVAHPVQFRWSPFYDYAGRRHADCPLAAIYKITIAIRRGAGLSLGRACPPGQRRPASRPRCTASRSQRHGP